jgi:hypothetical protein
MGIDRVIESLGAQPLKELTLTEGCWLVQGKEYADVVDSIVQTEFASHNMSLIVLGIHIVVGIVLAYIGVRRTRAE